MTRPRQSVCVVSTAQLSAHPGNIRDDLGDLEDMARSVREHGILQPLTVTEHPDPDPDPDALAVYRILDGHRRFKAALLAHETRVPVIIRHDLDDEAEQTVLMLVTGIHRRELSAVERARGYGRLKAAGLGISEIARRVGLTPSTVSYYLNLLRLDDSTLDKVEDGQIPVGEAVAGVREERQAERVEAGTPLRGRPSTLGTPYFGKAHALAPVVSARCTHFSSYGTVGRGPCWESAIREDALAQAVA